MLPEEWSVSQIPQEFDQYKILETLSVKELTTTVLAQNIKTHEKKICKFIDTIKIKNLDAENELNRELQIVTSLNYPGIISNEKIIYLKNYVILVVEYCERGLLSDYILKNGPLDISLILTITKILLKTMNYLHEMKLSHRELRTDSILLTNNFIPKIIKFTMSIWLSKT